MIDAPEPLSIQIQFPINAVYFSWPAYFRNVNRSLGLEAELLHYCPPEITQENALLLAWNPRTTATNSTSDL